MEKIRIFDTTLRDGEQAPGFSMNVAEKLRLAQQLDKMNVDIIEAGFPIASEGDFTAVQAVAGEIRGRTVAGLARAAEVDIVRAATALEKADRPRIHVFIATSDIHLEKKLNLSRPEVIERAVQAVRQARKYVDDVEFSAEDATRSNWSFLAEVYSAVIAEGCRTINVPDTVGYTTPEEFYRLIEFLRIHVRDIKDVTISVHCHNDLGLAVANSLAAVRAGARQVECTVNGIGERAGNAALEEVVMTLWTRPDLYPAGTEIATPQLYPSSRLLRHITGIPVQPNKAIVGANAFAHEAGIHQDGVLKDRRTYEIMTPETVGFASNILVLGKHSGRHAFKDRLEKLGYQLDEAGFENAFRAFKTLADKKKTVYDEDLETLVMGEILEIPKPFKFRSVNVASGTEMLPTATVELEIEGKTVKQTGHGDGPVDAAYKTIAALVGARNHLVNFQVRALTPETEAMGEVTVSVEAQGMTVIGRAAHTDIVVASAQAYVNALNKLAYLKAAGAKKGAAKEAAALKKQ
jgi:2-isopropylmalate synthase